MRCSDNSLRRACNVRHSSLSSWRSATASSSCCCSAARFSPSEMRLSLPPSTFVVSLSLSLSRRAAWSSRALHFSSKLAKTSWESCKVEANSVSFCSYIDTCERCSCSLDSSVLSRSFCTIRRFSRSRKRPSASLSRAQCSRSSRVVALSSASWCLLAASCEASKSCNLASRSSFSLRNRAASLSRSTICDEKRAISPSN
mmetsp:Transcript_64790/g.107708  ORF Transcript_64790/g.107708 Transcript_64790/m.107708 type:complete len:200 (+) Transcript_64790:467-1066(+)